MIKKHLAFLLALSLASLAACGKYAEPETDYLSPADTLVTTAQTHLEMTPTETTSGSSQIVTTTAFTETTLLPLTTKLTASAETTGTFTSVSGTVKTDAETSTVETSGSAPATTRRTTTQPRTTQDFAGNTGSETTSTTEQTETEPETLPASGETRMVGGILVADYGTDHPRAIEPFSNNHKVSTRYAQALEQCKAAVGEGINVWCMVVPTSQAFYTPEDVADQYGSQLDEYHNVTEHLENVTGIPVYNTLESHKSEPIYSRTDYHWQPLAAYYAGEQFAAFAGVPYAPLNTYEAVTREGYVGAFSKVNKVTLLEDYPEDFTYYKPANLEQINCTYYNTAFGNPRQGSLFHEDNGVNSSYTVFVGSDECILETETNVENSRVLVIFKDSYGNALVPFLTQSFSRIYLCDFRYFDRNAAEFMEEVGATDVLFAMSTVAVTTSGKVDQVAGLFD